MAENKQRYTPIRRQKHHGTIWRRVFHYCVYRLSPLDSLTYTPFRFGRLAAFFVVRSASLLFCRSGWASIRKVHSLLPHQLIKI